MITLRLARIRAALQYRQSRAVLDRLSDQDLSEQQADLLYRRNRAVLERLSDADLWDIGITRGKIDTAAKAPAS
jgi:uncharacterized protein YjiS (DUF1127 family)